MGAAGGEAPAAPSGTIRAGDGLDRTARIPDAPRRPKNDVHPSNTPRGAEPSNGEEQLSDGR